MSVAMVRVVRLAKLVPVGDWIEFPRVRFIFLDLHCSFGPQFYCFWAYPDALAECPS